MRGTVLEKSVANFIVYTLGMRFYDFFALKWETRIRWCSSSNDSEQPTHNKTHSPIKNNVE